MKPSAGKAFVLGAGLGRRLRPLTEQLPKPLVPVRNRPILAYALDHLAAELGVGEAMVNTHHRPEAYGAAFPEGVHRAPSGAEVALSFRHEPVLLETAGGLDNVRDWLPRDEPFAVYNGDILADFPLAAAWEQHLASGDDATLLLRSSGPALQVGFDPGTRRVLDIRGALRSDCPLRCQFTGVYFISPPFLRYLTPGRIESVVLPLLEAVRRGGRVGGFVAEGGVWSDLGEREAYLDALRLGDGFPAYAPGSLPPRLSPEAVLEPGAEVDGLTCAGPGAVVGAGASLRESVLWAGARAAPGARLLRTVVRGGRTASGNLENADV